MILGYNIVNGEKQSQRSDFTVINPCNETEISAWPETGHHEVAQACEVANAAFKIWRDVSRIKRADMFDHLAQLIKERKDELAEAISLETGKNKNESYAEVLESLHMTQVVASSGRFPFGNMFASELATKDAYVMRKPKGVIAVISPWNFAAAIGSFWSSAPAIVEGNCVVHKPSELTPYTAHLIGTLYNEVFPAGVYNLIHGKTETGKALVRNNHVKTILFTGSADAGQDIRRHCADTFGKTCSCECGSKSAVIVFDDGNFDLALEVSIASAFKLSGQRCVSSGRILIQRSIYDKFCEAFAHRASELRTGPPDDPKNFYGPIISRAQMDRVMHFNRIVEDDHDATVLLPGGRLGDRGFFLSPFVYKVEWGNKVYLKQEVFGPHVALVPFDNIDDAIRIYNDTEYGLALGVVTEDFRKMRRMRDECNTGMLYLNGGSVAAESHLPFGGVGKSGNGWKTASGTYQAVTDEIAVTTNYEHGITWAQGMK